MNTNIFVVGLIALVLIGGGVWYGVSQNNMQEVNNDAGMNEETGDDSAEAGMSGTGSFARLLGLESAVSCEFASTIDGNSSTGVFYTDGRHFRVDATSATSYGTFNSKMINDGEFQYVWGSGADGMTAIKMAVTEVEADDSSTNTDNKAMFDIEQDVTYDCQAWSVDNTMFLPPSDIQFMDMSAMMNGKI
jgi:hypothetical protein